MQFKNKAFEHEQEVRLVYWVSDDENDNLGVKEIKYRQKNGIVIPYFQVHFDDEQVKSLMVGPLIQAEIADSTINDMLIHRGYSGVKVTHSEIPIRY